MNVTLEEETSENAYYLLLPQIAIVFISWIQLVFSLNRFKGFFKFTAPELSSFYLFIISGASKWVAALSIRKKSFMFQLTSSLIGTALYGAAFVILYNNEFGLPTKQQSIGLLLSLITSFLWEFQHRMVWQMESSS
tara:strand:+ start:3121 stop:3528 length:408 start_codon:yes stop_codon:yes gene_type:complete